MGHPAYTDKTPEVPGDELWPIVRDDPLFGLRIFLMRPLDDDLDVALGHRLTYVPIHEVPAASVHMAAKVIESPAYVEV